MRATLSHYAQTFPLFSPSSLHPFVPQRPHMDRVFYKLAASYVYLVVVNEHGPKEQVIVDRNAYSKQTFSLQDTIFADRQHVVAGIEQAGFLIPDSAFLRENLAAIDFRSYVGLYVMSNLYSS